jgi:hypothetical protein
MEAKQAQNHEFTVEKWWKIHEMPPFWHHFHRGFSLDL